MEYVHYHFGRILLSPAAAGPLRCAARRSWGLMMFSVFQHARRCLVEARPAVQVICMLRFFVGALLGRRTGGFDRTGVLVGALGWCAASIAIYLYNGVTDREEDVANGSRRPIASGELPAGFAAGAAVAAAAVAVGCCAVVGRAELAAVTGYLLAGYAYSGAPFTFKRSYATVMPTVAALGLTTYLAGALSTGNRPGPQLAVFAVTNATWMALVGGISKDMSDVPGDRVAGRRSWPIVLGLARTRKLLGAVAAGVAMGFLAASHAYARNLTGCAAVMVIGAVAVSVACRFVRESATRSRCRLPYRAFMWTQHSSHLVLLCALGL